MTSRRTPNEIVNATYPFLTDWDPTDLPGTSVDPLGFDRGYNSLADKILPGLTNVAAYPRYLSLLCAGAWLSPGGPSPTPHEIQQRQQVILRLERYWALAQVLAAESKAQRAQGVRGVRYAEAQRIELARSGKRSSGSHFPLLARQVQYGCLGIYGRVASGMHLIDRKTLRLTPQFGENLGEAFVEETKLPKTLLNAVREGDEEVGLDLLCTWGEHAYIGGHPEKEEAAMLGQALHCDPLRSRMAKALEGTQARSAEAELDHLNRISRKLGSTNDDLVEAITAIIAYEQCYRIVLLAFERIRWRCSGPGGVRITDLAADDVVQECARSIPAASREFEKTIDKATNPDFKRELGERLIDVRAFLSQGAVLSPVTGGFVEFVLNRHTDVQHGKFDHGRRKLPWLEIDDGDVKLTTARASLISYEPRRPEDIPAHAYRTGAADALLKAAKGES